MKACFLFLLALSYLGANGQSPLPLSRPWSTQLEAHLQRIQSGNTDELGYPVYAIALTWAAAGYVDQATRLLQEFWKAKVVDPNDFHYDNDGIRVLWALSRQQPPDFPFHAMPVTEIVQDNWDWLFNLFPGATLILPDSIRSASWQHLTGLGLAAKATLLCTDIDHPDHRASHENRKEAVLAFSRYFSTGKPEGYDLYKTTSIAAIVAAGLGEEDSAKNFIRLWAGGYLRYPGSYMLSTLMKDTATARLLLQGMLAPVWGITDSSCKADLGRVLGVLSQRIKKGPSLVFGQITLKELLQRLSDSAISRREVDYDSTALRLHWLGNPPAVQEEISAAEKRLGIRLPNDYKSFLLLTNGFRTTSNVGVTFMPVADIGWLRDLDSQLVAVWGEPMAANDSLRAKRFRRSLLIGGLNEEQQFLLVPPDGEDKQWQYWSFATWRTGEEDYPTLRYYFEYELQFIMNL